MIVSSCYQLLRMLLALTVTLCFSLLLPACTYFNKRNDFNIQVRASHYLNPDIQGQSEPVVVTVYQLKSANDFKDLSYTQLLTQKNIKKEILDRYEIEIQPKETLNLKTAISQGVGALAIVAAFRDIEQANWIQLVKIDPNKPHKNLNIAVSTLSIRAELS